jgi:hypothetical protein
MGEMKYAYKLWVRKSEGKSLIRKILKTYGSRVWTGFTRQRIGISGMFL